LFAVAGKAAGGEELQHYICCCSQIDYEVSTQLGITSSSTHGTGDQLQPWAPAADSKPAVRCWWSTCGSSDPASPESRALSATGKRIGKTPPISSRAYSIFSSLLESLFHVGGSRLSSLPMMLSCRQSKPMHHHVYHRGLYKPMVSTRLNTKFVWTINYSFEKLQNSTASWNCTKYVVHDGRVMGVLHMTTV
jgi:hypothetical protein